MALLLNLIRIKTRMLKSTLCESVNLIIFRGNKKATPVIAREYLR